MESWLWILSRDEPSGKIGIDFRAYLSRRVRPWTGGSHLIAISGQKGQ